MANLNPYTTKEDVAILRYILDNNYFEIVQGNSMWKKMEKSNVCPGRSWQSLKTRYKNNIFVNIWKKEYNITEEELLKLGVKRPRTTRRSFKHSPNFESQSGLINCITECNTVDEVVLLSPKKIINKASNSNIDNNTESSVVKKSTAWESSDEEFVTPTSQIQITNTINNSTDENSPRVSNEDVADHAIPESNQEMCLDVLMERYGFNLITKNCRAIAISNAPGTSEGLKIIQAPWANKSGEDETPIDLEQIIAKTGRRKMPKISVRILRRDDMQIETESMSSDEDVDITNIDKTQIKTNSMSSNEEVQLGDMDTSKSIGDIQIETESMSSDDDVDITNIDKIQIKTNSMSSNEEAQLSDMGTSKSLGRNEGNIDEANHGPTVATKSKNIRSKKLFINPLAVIQKNSLPCAGSTKTAQIDKENKTSINVKSDVKERENKPSSSSLRGGPFLIQEEILILKFILDGEYEAAVKGNTLWRLMEKQNICPNRSWQSMKNRYKRNILQNLSRPEYKLTKAEVFRIRHPQADSNSRCRINLRLKNLAKDLPQLETKKTLTNKNEAGIADLPKDFYSLNMNWSDSD